jgi:cytochrome c-type biogenesis protein CcmF
MAGGIAAGVVALVFGLRYIYPLVCLILSVFVTLTIAAEFWRGARVISARSGTNIFASTGQLVMRNTRRYGGYIVHFAIVVIFIGIAGQAFNRDTQQEMAVGSRMTIGPYTIVCQNFDEVKNPNYDSERATLEILRDGKSLMMLYPERRFFLASQVTETMVAIQSTPLRDLYVVYAGRSPETNRPVIHAYLNPLVKCIWFGGLILVLGTALALIPSRQPVIVLRGATEALSATGGPLPESVGVVHGDD